MEFDDGSMVNEKLLTEHENELDDMLLTEENIIMDDNEDAYVMLSGENSPNEDELDYNGRDRIREEIEMDCTSVHLPPVDDSEYKDDEEADAALTSGR